MIKYIIFGMVFVKLIISYALFLIFLRILIFENENENETELRMMEIKGYCDFLV